MRTVVSNPLCELSSAILTATLTDETDAPVAGNLVSQMTLTLFDKDTEEVINQREDQDVLNANGGSLSAQGIFTLVLDPLDLVILYPVNNIESRIARLDWKYGSPPKTGRAEIEFPVENLHLLETPAPEQ